MSEPKPRCQAEYDIWLPFGKSVVQCDAYAGHGGPHTGSVSFGWEQWHEGEQ